MVLLAFLAFMLRRVDFFITPAREVSWMGAGATRFFVVSHLQVQYYSNKTSLAPGQSQHEQRFLIALGS